MRERRLRILLKWTLALVLHVVAVPLALADDVGRAQQLARQAAQVDELGDHKRAAELYLEAFQTDASQPNYLYAAARAEMTAGNRQEAQEHFEQFLQLADSSSDRADKARAYLADLRGGRLEDKLAEADRDASSGQWKEAARLYYDVWSQANSRWSTLFKAGAAAQEAGDVEHADEWLHQYLREAPKTAADRPEAEARLKKLAAQEQAQEQKNQPIETVTNPAQGGSNGMKTAGWVMVGTGVALIAGGAGLLLYGVTEESALNRELKVQDGLVTADTTYAATRARADTIGLHQTLGLVLAGAGVATAGVGTILLMLAPEKQNSRGSQLQLTPGPGFAGLALTGRF